MNFEQVVTLSTFALCLLPALLSIRKDGLFVPAHLFQVALFVPLLHFANLLNAEASFDQLYYLASHSAWVAYSWGIYFVALASDKYVLSDRHWLDKAKGISDGWLIMAFAAWIAFKIYLVSVYGVMAFRTFAGLGDRSIFNSNFSFKWWEATIEHYVMALSIGACMMWAFKATIIPNYWKKISVLLPLTVFALPFLVAMESPIGSRRLVLFLIIMGMLAHFKNSRMSARRWLLMAGPRLILLASLVIGISAYYQSVRSNFYESDISTKLTSDDVADAVQGVGAMLIPRKQSAKKADFEKEQQLLNRDGPFDLTYDIIRALGNGQNLTGGELTMLSFAVATPRAIVGENKTDVNIDEVISNRLSIFPKGEYIVVDFATSALAVFLADYGMWGIFLTPAVVVLGFAIISIFGLLKSGREAPWNLLWLGLIVSMMGSVENDLISIMVPIRDALLILPVALVMGWLLRIKLRT